MYNSFKNIKCLLKVLPLIGVSSDGNIFVVISKKKWNIEIHKIIRNQAEDS